MPKLRDAHKDLRAIAKRYGISDNDIYDLSCAVAAFTRRAHFEEAARIVENRGRLRGKIITPFDSLAVALRAAGKEGE